MSSFNINFTQPRKFPGFTTLSLVWSYCHCDQCKMNKIYRAILVAVSGNPPAATQTSELLLQYLQDPSPECAKCSEDLDTMECLLANQRSDDPIDNLRAPVDNHGWERLTNGIAGGCWWCINIWNQSKAGLSTKLSAYTASTEYTDTSNNIPRMDIVIHFQTRRGSVFPLIKYPGLNETCYLWVHYVRRSHDIPIPSLGLSTGLVQSLDYVSSRISHCEDHHEHCGQTARWIPTRLLNIHEEDGRFSLRVVLREDCPIGSKYATLSHRWGHNEMNLLVNIRGRNFPMIRWEDVPTLFAQAATVVHHLGIRYLWIDSLVRTPHISSFVNTYT